MRNGSALLLLSLGTLGISLVIGCAAAGDETPESAGDNPAAFNNVPNLPTVNPAVAGKFHSFAVAQSESSQVKSFATPQGFGPADLVAAYHIKALKTTATIAIVDAFNYPNAASDLASYRSQFGLPPCTVANGCLKIVNQAGAASPLPAAAPSGDDWTVEAALDLDMASAACPTCKLILFEADDDQGDGLFLANDGAATVGANVVSNSWGGPEDGTENTEETHFNHAGVGYFASTGDSGNNNLNGAGQYPSTSAFVTAVGGTTLVKTANTRGYSGKAWSDGGASCSSSIARPSFQPAISACAGRYNSDVAANADPNTGVAVFNKANGGWIVVGGTSASSPFVAGTMALYGIGDAGPGYSYEHPANWYDVHIGKDGTCGAPMCKAGIGWDGPTGNGTPNGHRL